MMNFELKHGGIPQFTPEFVETVTVTCIKNGGQLSKDLLLKLVGVGKGGAEEESFDGLLKFGTHYNFWSSEHGSDVSISNFRKFEKLSWSPLVFAEFLHDSLSHPDLENGRKWSSLSALLAWSYSLKLTQFVVRETNSYLIPKKWRDFENLVICDPLKEDICKNETQWNITKKWLRSFGMVFESKDSFNPFPQQFYEFATTSVAKDSPKTDIETLVFKFRENFPFLPNGKFGRTWSNYVKDVFKDRELPLELDCSKESDEVILSDQESLVLKILESKGIIKLELRNDAPKRYIMNYPRTGREISYFVGVGE